MKASLKLIRECTTSELMKNVGGKLCAFYEGSKCCKKIGKLTLQVDPNEKILEIKVNNGSVWAKDNANKWIEKGLFHVPNHQQQAPITCYVHSVEKVMSVIIEEKEIKSGTMKSSICIELETNDDENKEQREQEEEMNPIPIMNRQHYINQYGDSTENAIESLSPRTINEIIKECSRPKLQRSDNMYNSRVVDSYCNNKFLRDDEAAAEIAQVML